MKIRKIHLRSLICTAVYVFLILAGIQNFSANFVFAQSGSNSSNNSGGSRNSSGSGSNSNSDTEMSAQQFYGMGYRSMVGGIAIDAENALKSLARVEMESLSSKIRGKMQTIPSDLNQASDLRKISLRRLADQVRDARTNNKTVPESVLYLGGLTAVTHVVAVPEEKDIYLVGPAEGWTANLQGEIVGKISGKPILLFEDLLTVLRAWNAERPEVISVSIEPSKEALQRVSQLPLIRNPEQNRIAHENAMGMMNVLFTGVPDTSRVAFVLAAADYKMKRMSLGFEAAPVKGLASYPSMLRRSASSYAPRFWLEPIYATLNHDPSKLVWNIQETKIKALTEREYFDTYGNRKVSGKKDAAAEKWAQSMSARYDDLAKAEPIFAEAKNCMDLALVVALIYSEGLQTKTDNPFAFLLSKDMLAPPKLQAPKAVKAGSLIRTLSRSGSFISATGGILINPWETVKNNTKEDPNLAKWASAVVFKGQNWWAN
ncbi:MAG: DUF1598 domain-containing protein [Planctomycetia bacterium]|nr:DUF1598 domain-containing protein [Planctomycetia bacterium]